MIYSLMNKYKQYDMRFDEFTKVLYIRGPMLVEDYVNMKNIIREYNLDVRDIIQESW